jgi:hypothetical protein
MNILIVIAIIFIIVLVVIIAIGIRRDESSGVGVEDLPPEFDLDEEGAATVVPRDPEYHWPKMFAPKSGRLDDEARLRLIHDLALVRAAWCVPILQQAYEEERNPDLRRAAREALTACEGASPVSP